MNFKRENKGLTICYIGDGKGKTSAAMGLAARASGAGLNVCILQFVKARAARDMIEPKAGEWPLSNEIKFFQSVKIPESLGRIDCEQTGLGFVGILGDEKERALHIAEAKHGLARAREILTNGRYQAVIFDELISALEIDLLAETDIIELIKAKPASVHLVLTGHVHYPNILQHCDLVTEMKAIDHPYYHGILAQAGIDY